MLGNVFVRNVLRDPFAVLQFVPKMYIVHQILCQILLKTRDFFVFFFDASVDNSFPKECANPNKTTKSLKPNKNLII